jgi:hypothetical protein
LRDERPRRQRLALRATGSGSAPALCVGGVDGAGRPASRRARRRRHRGAGPPLPGSPPERGRRAARTRLPSPLRAVFSRRDRGPGDRSRRVAAAARLHRLRRRRKAARRSVYGPDPRPSPTGVGGARRNEHPRRMVAAGGHALTVALYPLSQESGSMTCSLKAGRSDNLSCQALTLGRVGPSTPSWSHLYAVAPRGMSPMVKDGPVT